MLREYKKLYKSASKCDCQQQYKDISEAAIVFTTEGLTYKIRVPAREVLFLDLNHPPLTSAV